MLRLCRSLMSVLGALLAVFTLSISLAGCSSAAASSSEPEVVRLGYFPNVTHAPAIVGVVEGLFQTELGDVQFEVATFNAGTEAVEALFSGAVDMSFIGPNPAINAFAQSDGEAVRIVAGTTSGGAALVVRDGIDGPVDLLGCRLATPSLGNTQDVALRVWLITQGLDATLEGGGDVSVMPQSNAQTLQTFLLGDIDGAWAPEPWATRLVQEGGGQVLVDERNLWPEGHFVTTHLVVSTSFLENHPAQVQAVLRGLIASVDFCLQEPSQAQTAVNSHIEALTGKALPAEVISAAWGNLTFTLDPIASSLRESADDAVTAGLLEPVDLEGIYALDLLNEMLLADGRVEVHE